MPTDTYTEQEYPYVSVLRNMQYTPPTFSVYLYHQIVKFNLKSNTDFVSTGYISYG